MRSRATSAATAFRPTLPVVLMLLLLAALHAGCAGRRVAEEAPARPSRSPAPAATPVLVPPPPPAPTPVPPALACAGPSDCTLTPFGHAVASAAGCYCPTCPVARNAAIAAQNEASWQRLCGAAWAEQAGCLAPMCPRPVAPGCTGGACTAASP